MLIVFLPQALPVCPDRLLNCIQKILVAEGFGQKIDRTILDRLDPHGDVAMAGNENHGQADIKPLHSGMKFRSALTRHTHIEDKAGRDFFTCMFEKFIHRGETERL